MDIRQRLLLPLLLLLVCQRQHLDTMLLLDIAVVVVSVILVVEVFAWCGFSILPFHNEWLKSFVFCVLNLLAWNSISRRRRWSAAPTNKKKKIEKVLYFYCVAAVIRSNCFRRVNGYGGGPGSWVWPADEQVVLHVCHTYWNRLWGLGEDVLENRKT